MQHRLLPAILALIASAAAAQATEYPAGYLCCNMRTDGSWISDSNYREGDKTVISAGTRATVTGYGRNRVYVDINGRKQALGNDYSRNITLEDFANRYVVMQDPMIKIATYPRNIQQAIANARVTKGMSREQVLMAIGYPIADENPDLDNNQWRYWISSFAEFVVLFNDKGSVENVETDATTRPYVFQE